MESELCYITAVNAIQQFRAKTLSPVELMQAVIARAEAVEPQINAFSFTYYEEAMAAARLPSTAWSAAATRTKRPSASFSQR